MTAGMLIGIIMAVAWTVWHRARKSPDWRLHVCRGHGGDAIDKCDACAATFCRECQPEGHCVPQYYV